MGDTRLIHDAAFAGAAELAERVEEQLIKPEERNEFHRQAYLIIKASIEYYVSQKTHETKRLGARRDREAARLPG